MLAIQLIIACGMMIAAVQSQTAEEGDPQDLAHPHADACVWTGGACEWDFNMQAMTATFEGDRSETFYAYVEPDVSTFYNQTEGQLRVVEPDFTGLFLKFVNMSPKSVRLHWYVLYCV